MLHKVAVNLGNLLLSISDAMDLASPRLMQHQQRVAFASWEMSKAAKLSDQRIERGFIAAILHDIGAFSMEDKVAVRETNLDDGAAHAAYGARLLEDVSYLSDSSDIVRNHHRQWSDWHEGIDAPHVMETQILALADHLERRIDRNRFVLHQHEEILKGIRSLSGTVFHPDVVELLMKVSGREEFWFDLVSPRLYSLLLTEGPYRKIETDLAGICWQQIELSGFVANELSDLPGPGRGSGGHLLSAGVERSVGVVAGQPARAMEERKNPVGVAVNPNGNFDVVAAIPDGGDL